MLGLTFKTKTYALFRSRLELSDFIYQLPIRHSGFTFAKVSHSPTCTLLLLDFKYLGWKYTALLYYGHKYKTVTLPELPITAAKVPFIMNR
jgi:hypothetical protein